MAEVDAWLVLQIMTVVQVSEACFHDSITRNLRRDHIFGKPLFVQGLAGPFAGFSMGGLLHFSWVSGETALPSAFGF